MDDKEKTLDKIKKLLKLGKNTNFSGEAHQALAAAMRLAAGIGMTIEEIDIAEEDANQIGITTTGKFMAHIPYWQTILASGVGEALGYLVLIMSGRNGNLKRESFRIVGTKADGALFCWLFPYLVKQMTKLCHRDWDLFGDPGYDRKKWQKSWYIGAVDRVVKMAKDFFNENATQDEQQQYALVVANKFQQAQDWANNQMKIHTSKSRKRTVDAFARRLGYDSGSEVTMARPIENNEQVAVEA